MSSDAGAPAAEPPSPAQPSCYLLEYSVGSGGARLADIFAHGTLAGLREQVVQRSGDPIVIDPYLVMWYGAFLHLWVVRGGRITEGIDLHPLLRTGNPEYDRTLARACAVRESEDAGDEALWSDIDDIIRGLDWAAERAFPLITRLFTLHDQAVSGTAEPAAVAARAALAQLREGIADGKLPDLGGPTVDRISLDWDALTPAVPPIDGPLLAAGRVGVTWADETVQQRDSHLIDACFGPVDLYAGCNDLENGEDEFVYPEDEDRDR